MTQEREPGLRDLRTGYVWAADAWAGTNPCPVPFFVVTHHPEDAPAGSGFTRINGLEAAIVRARVAAAAAVDNLA